MSSRFGNPNLSLVGFILILLTLGSLVYLIHMTQVRLEETKEGLRNSNEKLQALTKQYEFLSDYKIRLEEAFMNMKSDKASILQNDQRARDELEGVRDLCAKQVESLEGELLTCQNKVRQEGSPSSPSLGKYLLRPSGDGSQVSLPKSSNAGSEFNVKDSSIITPMDSNPQQQQQQQHPSLQSQPLSGNPNEDLAGNVLI